MDSWQRSARGNLWRWAPSSVGTLRAVIYSTREGRYRWLIDNEGEDFVQHSRPFRSEREAREDVEDVLAALARVRQPAATRTRA
jgi:hypothetical protein